MVNLSYQDNQGIMRHLQQPVAYAAQCDHESTLYPQPPPYPELYAQRSARQSRPTSPRQEQYEHEDVNRANPLGQNLVHHRDNLQWAKTASPERRLVPSSSEELPLPCVLPQTTKAFRGAFFSPFVRAYVPELEACGIDQDTFLAFVDGLNEAFVANPLLQYAGIAGGVMTQFYGVHPVQWAGIGLQVTTGVASFATSYLRTKAYVKAVNTDLFHPAGLHLNVMSTKKMTEKIENPGEKLQLPPLDTFDDLSAAAMVQPKKAAKAAHAGTPENNACMRRVEALEGYVMPLHFDVPDAVAPDSLMKKMGASQARRMAKRQHKNMVKTRVKGHEEYLKKMNEANKKWREGSKDVEKVKLKLAKEEAKLGREIAKDPGKAMRKFENEQEKLLRELQKKEGKRDKEVNKETRAAQKERNKIEKKEGKTANGIRWLVIAKWNGDESQSDSEEAVDEGSPSCSAK